MVYLGLSISVLVFGLFLYSVVKPEHRPKITFISCFFASVLVLFMTNMMVMTGAGFKGEYDFVKKIFIDIELYPLSMGFFQIVSVVSAIASGVMLVKDVKNSGYLIAAALFAYFCMSIYGIDLKLLFFGLVLIIFAVSSVKKICLSRLYVIILMILMLFLFVFCNAVHIDIPSWVLTSVFLVLSGLFIMYIVKMFIRDRDLKTYSRSMVFGVMFLEMLIFLIGSINGYSELQTYITCALIFHFISGVIFELIYLVNGETEIDKNEELMIAAMQIFPAGGLFSGVIYTVLGCLSVPDGTYLIGALAFVIFLNIVYIYRLFKYYNKESGDLKLGMMLCRWKNPDFYIKGGLLITYVIMGMAPVIFLKGSKLAILTFWGHTKPILPKEIIYNMFLVSDIMIIFVVLLTAYIVIKMLYLYFKKV